MATKDEAKVAVVTAEEFAALAARVKKLEAGLESTDKDLGQVAKDLDHTAKQSAKALELASEFDAMPLLEATEPEPEKGPIPKDLLKLVQRPATDDKGKVKTRGDSDTPVLRNVRADEVMDWKDYEDRVVVVTTDGQRFVGAKNA